MKINPKFTSLLMGLIISFGMSLFMSFTMTAINQGFIEGFFLIWMKTWGIAFAVGFPAAAAIVPVARKIVSRVTHTPLGR